MNRLSYLRIRNVRPGEHFLRIPWFFGRLIMVVVGLSLMSSIGVAADFCTQTAKAAFKACQHEVKDDFWISMGNCNNLSDPNIRAGCEALAVAVLGEDLQLCREQWEARLEVCKLLGEARYDPQIDPSNFVDPTQIGNTVLPNSYFPLIMGTTRTYSGGGQITTVSVTKLTKTILGVTCVVVRDIVQENGQTIEDTEDWFAQDVQGNVWYFGEISQEFNNGELVSLEGSWKAGIDGAKPGIIMMSFPQVGNVYRQEFALGGAEDLAQVLSLTGSTTGPVASCNGNCLVTKDFTPIEPNAEENKYYAPGIGLILEIDLETGERMELIDIKTNP
jgi:hypothetical protein